MLHSNTWRRRLRGAVRLTLATAILAGCGVSQFGPVPAAGRAGESEDVATYAAVAAKDIAARTGGDPRALAGLITTTHGQVTELAWQRAGARPSRGQVTVAGNTERVRSLLTLPMSAGPTSNTVDVLIDADRIFSQVEQAVRGARYRIQADLFLLGGRIGTRLAQALDERRRAGVDVRIVLDPHFAAMGPARQQALATLAYLRDHGVPVRTFPLDALDQPASPFARASLIDHDKIVVVDDQAFVGCANLIDAAETNHDLMFRVRGPVAAELSHWLDLTWEKSNDLEPRAAKGAPSRTQLPAPAYRATGTPAEEPTTLVRLTRTDRTEHSTYDRILALVGSSRKISIGSFELDDDALKAGLIAARRRGADVRVLLDRHQMDSKYTGRKLPAGIPNWLAVRDLLAAGIPVKWFEPWQPLQEMHLKMSIYDDRTALVGSTNLTTRAFRNYRETGLELEGGPAVADLVAMFDRDWAEHATSITTMTAFQRALAATIAFLDRHDIGWW